MNFRVNFMPAMEISNDSIKLVFKTKVEAEQNLDSMANLLLFMQDNAMMNDFSNSAWVEQYVDGEWEEVVEDD